MLKLDTFMSTSVIKQLPKSTVEIEIKIPWVDISDTYEKIFIRVINEFEFEGFRKGKVPRKIVEEHVDRSKVYQEVIKEIVPKAYQEAVMLHKLAPVISPKVEVIKAKEKEEWQIKATVAQKPKIDLKNYKEKIRSFKKSKPHIWTPNQKTSENKEDKKPSLDELMKIIIEEADIEISDLLILEESNRLLASLVDQTQKLGLTVEQYLVAKGKTTDQIRAEYATEAAKNLKLEFALAEIADLENITVTQEDLDKILAKVEKPEEKERLKKDSYYLAHLLRQQKTLDFLYNL
ncbi:hypothetical protein HY029_00420 [Candidatus Gottesmanbacteria bacterium]|nr:hypothetical protein [Candidatus Gottesmanbacteria bacterium]